MGLYNRRTTMATSTSVQPPHGPHCRALRRRVIGDAIDDRIRHGIGAYMRPN
jgi:hypothetical protein